MLLDVYVLAKSRNMDVLQQFLDKFAKGFIEAAAEYEFPQYSDRPAFITEKLDDLIKVLFEKPDGTYSIYWRGPNPGEVHAAMAFFTADNGLILGLTVPEEKAKPYLALLLRCLNGQCGGILFETPPPKTVKQFLEAFADSGDSEAILADSARPPSPRIPRP